MTTPVDPIDLESIVGHLGADELAHLGSSLTARATACRRPLTIQEAWAAYDAAPLTAAWHRSIVPETGRVRSATRILVADRRLHPEQVVDAMTEVAEQVCCHPCVAAQAVAAGIADGRAVLEGAT